MNSKDTTLRRSGIRCSRWVLHQNLADSSFSDACFLNKLLSLTERSTLSIEHVAFDLGFGDNRRTIISHTCAGRNGIVTLAQYRRFWDHFGSMVGASMH